jgi:hypothetical protein
MDILPLSSFVSKMILFYHKFVRESFAQQYRDRECVDSLVFVHTATGRSLSSADVTRLLQSSCRWCLGDRNLTPTSNSLRHAFATFYWKEWRRGSIYTHIKERRVFLEALACRLNTSPKMLRSIYISEGVLVPLTGDALLEPAARPSRL